MDFTWWIQSFNLSANNYQPVFFNRNSCQGQFCQNILSLAWLLDGETWCCRHKEITQTLPNVHFVSSRLIIKFEPRRRLYSSPPQNSSDGNSSITALIDFTINRHQTSGTVPVKFLPQYLPGCPAVETHHVHDKYKKTHKPQILEGLCATSYQKSNISGFFWWERTSLRLTK